MYLKGHDHDLVKFFFSFLISYNALEMHFNDLIQFESYLQSDTQDAGL